MLIMETPKSCQIIHVDMDAFFASVEQLDEPSLNGKAVIVGGDPKGRGVVSAASYLAREFGVHSAMPMSRAVRLCPDAVVLPGRMWRYVEISGQIRNVFERFTPIVEPISLDEAFLDVTSSIPLFDSAEKIGRDIKKAILEEIGLVASVGIAGNKFLAKLASDLDKPDGFVVITEENKQQVLDGLSIGKIWGVGKVTREKLYKVGIRSIGELRGFSADFLRGIVGNYADTLIELANGIDGRAVESAGRAKSISTEKTFAEDVGSRDILLGVLLDQSDEVAQRLRASNLKTKTVTLKLRYGNFRTITRSQTLANWTNSTDELWSTGQAIFNNWYSRSGAPLRLIGFSASNLTLKNTGQMELFRDIKEIKQTNLDRTIDEIRGKFGNNSIKRNY